MTKKTESRFYIGQTINEIKGTIKNRKETLKTKIDAQTKKHITSRVETSSNFIADLKKDPRKKMDAFINDNKTRVNDFAKDSKKTYQEFINDSKKTATKVVKGVKADAKLVRNDITDLKNKTFDKKVAKDFIEKRVNKITKRIPSKLPIPTRKEVEALMTGIDGISKKVDALNKQYA